METIKELIYDKGEWTLARFCVIADDETKYENDIAFYEAMVELHPDFAFTATELAYTNAQLNRLATANKLNANNGNYDEIYNFVMSGTYDTSNDAFALLKPAQNRADIDYIAMESGVEL